ncbi:PUL-domain-containing protein [Pleurostoma richardsiae]|uniref:PUL-domain-containing protein n=1 Tax=Pleurostoma richardsiae TaxID=41990 RepID=A0AA38RCH2_9PEZI|nr:PUL-domain-containing protein [Pleurostoma richardsiae]
MDVHLLVYDLSGGMARNLSAGLLGFQLDAVYHTSIMLNGKEYVYDGNVVAIRPGSSHLGRPLQQIHLGKTDLPMDVVEEYIDSLREIYTVEAYNLWRHNCNNFSNDLATFLLGKGIPDHILHMPQAVLNSPFGQMLLPALEQQINANRQNGGILGIQGNAEASSVKPKAELHHHRSTVREAANLQELDSLLSRAQKSCAVVFFTSATCAPCKALYPLYDELAEEVGNKGVLVKVDTSRAFDVGAKYSIRATPTFVTFLHGKEENRWSGADPGALRGNVQLLVQMAWPTHPHRRLNLAHFSDEHAKPVLYEKMPPLPKLMAKMGPAAQNQSVKAVTHFLEARSKEGPAEAPLPDMNAFTTFLQNSIHELPPEVIFTVVDLLRCGLVDPRFSGYLAEEHDHRTIISLLEYINGLANCPYALRLVSLQMACNLFSSQLYPDQILGNDRLRASVTQLISTSFLDDSHSSVRVAASSLLYNVALSNSNKRRDGPGDALPEGDQIELAASTLEAISQEEESPEALKGMLLALGYLVYLLPLDGELADLLRTMDAETTILGKKKKFKDIRLIDEVGKELLGKGLRQ